MSRPGYYYETIEIRNPNTTAGKKDTYVQLIDQFFSILQSTIGVSVGASDDLTPTSTTSAKKTFSLSEYTGSFEHTVAVSSSSFTLTSKLPKTVSTSSSNIFKTEGTGTAATYIAKMGIRIAASRETIIIYTAGLLVQTLVWKPWGMFATVEDLFEKKEYYGILPTTTWNSITTTFNAALDETDATSYLSIPLITLAAGKYDSGETAYMRLYSDTARYRIKNVYTSGNLIVNPMYLSLSTFNSTTNKYWHIGKILIPLD